MRSIRDAGNVRTRTQGRSEESPGELVQALVLPIERLGAEIGFVRDTPGALQYLLRLSRLVELKHLSLSPDGHHWSEGPRRGCNLVAIGCDLAPGTFPEASQSQ
jgi:hypothetical protein